MSEKFESELEGWWNDEHSVYTWPITVGEWGSRVECHGHSPVEAQSLAFRIVDALAAQRQAKPKGCTKPDCFPYCDCGTIDDYVPPAATPSEDGGEVPEVVAYVTTGFSGGSRTRRAFTVTKVDADQQHENWLPHYRKVTTDDLMTVAQHSRIVAAKDAEIARLKLCVEIENDALKMMTDKANELNDEIHSLEDELEKLRAHPSLHESEPIAEIRYEGYEPSNKLNWLNGNSLQSLPDGTKLYTCAQPARQVGGDERPQFEAWVLSKYQGRPDFLYRRDALPKSDEAYGEYVQAFINNAWIGWQARAALAPAAVVMPERMKIGAEASGFQNGKMIGFNSALDEVARLNRRAIPVELLERCLEQMESDWLQIDGEWGPIKGGLEGAVANGDAEEIRELRALLGKDGSQ